MFSLVELQDAAVTHFGEHARILGYLVSKDPEDQARELVDCLIELREFRVDQSATGGSLKTITYAVAVYEPLSLSGFEGKSKRPPQGFRHQRKDRRYAMARAMFFESIRNRTQPPLGT